MQRLPLLLPALGWVLGVALIRVESITWQWDMWVVMMVCLWIAVSRHRYFCLWLLAGMIWGGISFVHDIWQIHHDASWVNQAIEVQAEVESIQYHGFYTRLRLNDVLRDDGQRLHGRVDVYLWSHLHIPKEGQRIHATVKLHAPRNHQNPGGFDYESYCFSQHIGLVGSIKSDGYIVSEQQRMLARMRAKVRDVLPKDAEQRGILSALLLAERYAIPIDIQDAFSATGTAHLLAISGLHVGMVAAWVGFLAFYVLTRREAWIIHTPVKALSLMVGVAVAIAYASLAGWPLPTQRAALMLVAAALAWYLRAHYMPINILLAALMLILGWDASAITSISLWLSFLATLSLLMLMQGSDTSSNKAWVYVKSLMKVSLLASLLRLSGSIFLKNNFRFPDLF